MSATQAFPQAAARELADEQLRANLRRATHTIRAKRAAAVAEVPDWEELREAGRAIKQRTLERLDEYLVAVRGRGRGGRRTGALGARRGGGERASSPGS